MFKKEVLEGCKGLEHRWRKTCEKSYGDKMGKGTSLSGIPVKGQGGPLARGHLFGRLQTT